MKQIMLGNEAFARGAYEAGLKVVSSYPGTPSTEITETLAKCGSEVEVEWAPNEKVALEVAIGASIGGARALCCMKHVGVNVAADPLFTAAYTGVNGGLVIVAADDPGMHSSQNEQDSRFYARSAHVPMLEASDSAEACAYMKAAFDLSEKYDTPVMIRSNTRLSHSRGIVDTCERQEKPLKDYVKDPMKYVMMPGMAIKRHLVVEQREKALADEGCSLNRVEMRDTKIGVITAGVCYQYVREALPEASVLKLAMVYPLDEKLIRDFAAKVEKLYIVEELEPFFETQIKAMGIPCIGKEIFTVQGEYSVNMIKKAIAGEETASADPGQMPVRPPVMCPGCPHRGVYYTLNKLGITAMGDIGCYTLGALAPLSAIDACVCMGASIGMAVGMEKARGKDAARKLVSVIGDSTFLHSGMTGLLNMVYNGATSTLIILDNSTTGMTGHQEHAGTGKNAKGEVAPAVDLEQLVAALGVKHIKVVDSFDLKGVEAALKEETAREEPSVIIARRPCALLDKKNVQPPVKCDQEKCRKCGLCMKLGCPAIIREGRDIRIDATLCTGCGLCAEVCPFGAMKKEGEC